MFKRNVELHKDNTTIVKNAEDVPAGKFFIFDTHLANLVKDGILWTEAALYYKISGRTVVAIDKDGIRVTDTVGFSGECVILPEVELKVLIKGLYAKNCTYQM